MLSPFRITLENNGKIRLEPDRENAFARASGGETGIRTLGGVTPTTVFETAPFDHSGISPLDDTLMRVRAGVQGHVRAQHIEPARSPQPGSIEDTPSG